MARHAEQAQWLTWHPAPRQLSHVPAGEGVVTHVGAGSVVTHVGAGSVVTHVGAAAPFEAVLRAALEILTA